MRVALFVLILCAAGPAAFAQDTAASQPPAPALDAERLLGDGASEWMATTGPAFGVVVNHSAPGHNYFLSSFSWGRVLSGPKGRGLLRGRFLWAIEVVPLFSQRTPDHTVGFGLTPLTWRWNFDPHGKVAPFLELAGGMLWTRDPVPQRTAKGNFTAHAAYGIRYFLGPHHALVVNYKFHHISNANRLTYNPGVNAHLLQVGVSLVRPAPAARRAP